MAEAEKKSYRGNCHCGAFIFEVKAPEIKSAMSCNCSICTKKGYLWFFPREPITVVKGEGSLKEYAFGPKQTIHLFCPTCGIPVLGRNETGHEGQHVALNLRVFQDIDIFAIERQKYDGRTLRTLETPHVPPVFSGPEPAEVEGGKRYTGSCHCGAVAIVVHNKTLDKNYDHMIIECSCSICQRGGYVWFYPKKEHISIQGAENLSYYVCASGNWRKAFCKTCGVQIMNDLNPLSDEEVAAQPEEARERRNRLMGYRPVNMRTLDNFDLDTVKVSQASTSEKMEPLYVNP